MDSRKQLKDLEGRDSDDEKGPHVDVRFAMATGCAAALMLVVSSARAGINFDAADAVAVSPSVRFVTTGDLNRDGNLDVVLVTLTGELQIFVAAADVPSRLVQSGAIPLGISPRQAAIGDVNGDGMPDVACTDAGVQGVLILLGRGDGTFLAPYLVGDIGESPEAVAIADLDGHAGQDLLVADTTLGRVFVRLSNGTADPAFRRGPEVDVGERPEQVLAVDVNRDGRPDIVTLNLGGSSVKEVSVHLFRRLFEGFPEFERNPRRIAVGERPSNLIAAELGGDSGPDLAVINRKVGGGEEIVVLVNGGAGTFMASPFAVGCPFFTGGAPCRLLALAAADVDRNNRLDLAVAFEDPRRFGTSASGSDALQVFAGRGDGSFVPSAVFAVGKGTAHVAAGHLTGDCLPDLLVAARHPSTLQVLVNAFTPGLNESGNGSSCAQPDDCLSGRCTDGRCCAAACVGAERCDVAGSEGICRPVPPPIVRCDSVGDCGPPPGQPYCADGLCCDDDCRDGRCDVPGLEGLCIPSRPAGSPCEQDDECATGFCAGNLRCCLGRCEDGTCDSEGHCRPRLENGGPCLADDECRSGVCDAFDDICCNRRCDPDFEICFLTGECRGLVYTPAARAHATPPPAGREAARAGAAATCPADCDGDHVVAIDELIRLVGVALGTGSPAACPSGPLASNRCIAIDDIVLAVTQALAGCPSAQ